MGRRKTKGEGDARWNLRRGEKGIIYPEEEKMRVNVDISWEVTGEIGGSKCGRKRWVPWFLKRLF